MQTGTVEAADADGDEVTFMLDEPVDGLTLNEEGSFTFDPSDPAFDELATGETRLIVATFTATDEAGAEDQGTITITVTGDNDAPVITSGSTGNVDENAPATTVVFDLNATDPDGDPVVFTLESEDAARFTIDPDDGEVRLIAPADFETDQEFRITVVATDPFGEQDRQAVLITVNDVAEPAGTTSLDQDTDNDTTTTNTVVAPAGQDTTFLDDADVASNATITGFDMGDVIGTDTTGTVTFTNTGTNDLTITITEPDPDGTGPGTATTSTIVLEDAVLATDVITDEATAEAAIGSDFFLNSQGEGTLTSVDSQNGETLTIAAAPGDFAFIDNEDAINDAVITGDVATGDTFTSNAEPTQVTFSDNGAGELIVTVTNGTATSTFTFEDAVAVDAVVTDEASAELALGVVDFFQFG